MPDFFRGAWAGSAGHEKEPALICMSEGGKNVGPSVYGDTLRGLALAFCTALGVILGGALIGSLPGFLTPEPPFYRMQKLATDMKLWAVVVALGARGRPCEQWTQACFKEMWRPWPGR